MWSFSYSRMLGTASIRNKIRFIITNIIHIEDFGKYEWIHIYI